jgi:DNA polymerase-3 subunit epsilon
MRPIAWARDALARRRDGARRASEARARPWREVVYWALDLETTGLDPATDHVLSVGLVPVRRGTIRYGERFHRLVRPPGPLDALSSEGLRAHHILPAELSSAPPLPDVLPEVDRRVREGALVLHHAPLDLAFLARGYDDAGMAWPRPPVVDTVELLARAHRLTHRFDPAAAPAPASLARGREACGLPPHRAHDALADAVATAELFLALVARLDIARAGELY